MKIELGMEHVDEEESLKWLRHKLLNYEGENNDGSPGSGPDNQRNTLPLR